MFPSLSVRFVWFTEDHSKIKISELFRELVGEDADEVTISKLPTAQNPFLGQAAKSVNGRAVMLQLQIGRLDLVFQPEPAQHLTDVIETVETESALEFGISCIRRADNLPRSIRLSVVANTVELVEDIGAAGRRFQAMIGLDSKIEGLTDHLFQANRITSFDGAAGNRLVQYSTSAFQRMRVQFSGQSGQGQQSVIGVSFGVCATYDFNTVPDGTVFEVDKQKAIFGMIVDEVKRAATLENLTFLEGQ